VRTSAASFAAALIMFSPFSLYSRCVASGWVDYNRARLTRELEKKFSDRHVVFVAQRRVLPKPTRNSRVKQKRPRSRTLTSVHDKILEDLVFPTEIVGKRTRVSTDGSKLLKVYVWPMSSPLATR
jgi:hypothetical protein